MSAPKTDRRSIERTYGSICASWRALSRSDRRRLLAGLQIAATYNSTKIENDRIDIHDTQAILGDGSVINYTGSLRDLYEIDNHGRAWSYACGLALDDFHGLNVKGLLRLQGMLTEHTYDADRWSQGERPGTFKLHDYGVGINQEVGSSPDKCQSEIEDLLGEVNEYLGRRLGIDEALTCATYLHARLVDIHPFADGNGRTARLLQNMYLVALGHPAIVQRAEDKMAYFGALDQFHDEGDLRGLIRFNQVETCLTWVDGDLV